MTVDLTAYPYKPTKGWTIEPATLARTWMDQTVYKAAYRCLPMAVANQAGWMVGCPVTFSARWSGKHNEMTTFTFPSKKDEEIGRPCVRSFFGSGIISFVIPWLFRTSEGYGLWARGPSNAPKPDVAALEGLVETDWSPYPFTMNWKIMRPRADVWFKAGEPVCMLVPYPMALLEEVRPRVGSLEEDPQLAMNLDQAKQNRLKSMQTRAPQEQGKWELTYTRGMRPDGVEAPCHRTNLKLAAFEDPG